MIIATKILAGAAFAGLLATGISGSQGLDRARVVTQPALAMAAAEQAADDGERQVPASVVPQSVQYCQGGCDWSLMFRVR